MREKQENQLIAEFMGWEKTKEGYITPHNVAIYSPPEILDDYSEVIPLKLMEFRSSYNWLMPVLEKIEMMGYNTEINCVHGNKEYLYIVEIQPLDGSTNHYAVRKDRKKAIFSVVLDCIIAINKRS